MRFLTRTVLVLIALASVAPLCLTGCSSSDEGVPKENQPPRVWLSSAPPEGSVDKYTIHLFWGGWDPDGEIAYYEYAITDNEDRFFDPADTTGADKWHRVDANDSTYTFSADILADSNTTSLVSEFRRSHTFFIRAVDEQGLRSLEPAYRSFTARTLSPQVSISVPQRSGVAPALVPAITTFRWTARDYVDNLLSVQDPDSVQFALVSADNGYVQTIDWLRENGPEARASWRPWIHYGAPNDEGKFWTSEVLDRGQYIFAIRAKDEAGAITPVLDEAANVRRLRVTPRNSGPLMILSNEYLGSVVTSNCNTPVVILDLPAGIPLRFCWTASAESYGGLVSGYRYGWDISDLSDPDQWETDLTPFTATQACAPERTYFFGTHTLTAEVVDNSGYCSRIEVKINIVQFSFVRNLLLVDDFTPDKNTSAGWSGSARGLLPNDAEHDAFWLDMLDDVEGFGPEDDVIEVKSGDQIPLTFVARYKNIVWSAFSDKQAIGTSLPLLYTFIQHRQKNPLVGGASGKRQPNLVALFMAAGGHVFINGTHPMSSVINRDLAGGPKYPIIFQYELEGKQDGQPNISNPVGDLSFGYKEMCVDVLDYCVLAFGTRRGNGLYCDVLSQRKIDGNVRRDDTLREAVPLDLNFPRLRLRPEAAATGKAYQPSEKGLDAEVYNPQYFFDRCDYVSGSRDCFQPIYKLECFDTAEPIYGQPVAFWSSRFADVVPEAPGGVAARSVVFGFAPVYFNPAEVKPAIEYILFDEWQLPRKSDQ